MSSRRWDPSSVRRWLARRERGESRAGHAAETRFAARWAVEACDHCGQTLVMGEPGARVKRFGREVVLCPSCLARVPDRPTWVAAPPRHGRPAVPLVRRERDLRRAA